LKEYLYETKTKNDVVDATNENINTTIDKFIDDETYRDLLPALTYSETKRDSVFFQRYDITPANGLTSDEYKTISYLAQFYKEKIKYSVNNIQRYLEFLGWQPSRQICTIMCLEEGKPYYGDIEDCISFEDYLKLYYYDEFHEDIHIEFNNKIIKSDTLLLINFNETYLDGFDKYIDNIAMR